MARDTYKTRLSNPLVAWIAMGLLLATIAGMLALYMLRPGRSSADDARTAAAIGRMDQAQSEANARRDARRSADSLLN